MAQATYERAPAVGREPVRLPWHLRKAFVLPVVAILLLGALSSITLLAAATYGYVRFYQAAHHLRQELTGMGLGQLGSAASDESPSDSTGDGGDDEADSISAVDDVLNNTLDSLSDGQGVIPVDRGYEVGQMAATDLVYEGSGTASSTSVMWSEDGEGEEGSDGLGATFRVPLVGSAHWPSRGFMVSANDGGTVECQVQTESGRILAHDAATGPDAEADCSLD